MIEASWKYERVLGIPIPKTGMEAKAIRQSQRVKTVTAILLQQIGLESSEKNLGLL